MDIEAVVVAGLAISITSIAVILYRRRKDVLYGPYIVSPFQQRWRNIAC